MANCLCKLALFAVNKDFREADNVAVVLLVFGSIFDSFKLDFCNIVDTVDNDAGVCVELFGKSDIDKVIIADLDACGIEGISNGSSCSYDIIVAVCKYFYLAVRIWVDRNRFLCVARCVNNICFKYGVVIGKSDN